MKNNLVFICLTSFVVFSSCKHDPTPPLVDESTLPANICFSDKILPMIKSNCYCHAENQDPKMGTYDDISKLVVPGDPQNSQLYKYAIEIGRAHV